VGAIDGEGKTREEEGRKEESGGDGWGCIEHD